MSTALYDEQVASKLEPGAHMLLVPNPIYEVAAHWNALSRIDRVHAVILFASMAFFVIALCVFVLGVHPATPGS